MVNLAFRQSFLTLKNGDGAYIAFIAFYVVCCLVTWVFFMRQRPGRLLGGLVAGLTGVVRVEWGGHRDAARSVRGGDHLVGVAFEAAGAPLPSRFSSTRRPTQMPGTSTSVTMSRARTPGFRGCGRSAGLG